MQQDPVHLGRVKLHNLRNWVRVPHVGSVFSQTTYKSAHAAAAAAAATAGCIQPDRWNGKRFSQLPEATQLQVAQYAVDCVIVRPVSGATSGVEAAPAANAAATGPAAWQGELSTAGVLALTV